MVDYKEKIEKKFKAFTIRVIRYRKAVLLATVLTVGLLSLLSGPVFGTLSDRIGRKKALSLVFSIQTLAYLLVAFSLPQVYLYLSIFCFGIVAWATPSIMAALVGDYVGPQKAARIFGIITFIFAIGQILGPAVAGMLAEKTGSFADSFLMAGFCAMAGAGLSLLLKPPIKKAG